MKRNLIAITVGAALSLGSIVAIAQPGPGGPDGPRGHHGDWGNPLEHLTKELNLTPDQQAKVGPIVEQAKPQIQQIHRDAMEKTRAIMENATAQIRPLLTAEQQQKLDAMKKAHEDMHNAMKEMHDAKSQQP
jgi:protein CpxP